MYIMDAQTCCLIARMGARLVIVAVEVITYTTRGEGWLMLLLRSLHTLPDFDIC